VATLSRRMIFHWGGHGERRPYKLGHYRKTSAARKECYFYRIPFSRVPFAQDHKICGLELYFCVFPSAQPHWSARIYTH